MKYAAVVFVIYLVAALNAAQAETGLYAGVGYAQIKADDVNVDFDATQFVVGVKFNKVLAVEGRYFETMGDESISGVNLSLDEAYGLYAVITAPIDGSLKPYLVIGRTHGKATASATDCYSGYYGYCDSYSASEGGTETSRGVGVSYVANQHVTFRAEYMQTYDDVKTTSLSLLYNF